MVGHGTGQLFYWRGFAVTGLEPSGEMLVRASVDALLAFDLYQPLFGLACCAAKTRCTHGPTA